jgi:hypothetical protein
LPSNQVLPALRKFVPFMTSNPNTKSNTITSHTEKVLPPQRLHPPQNNFRRPAQKGLVTPDSPVDINHCLPRPVSCTRRGQRFYHAIFPLTLPPQPGSVYSCRDIGRAGLAPPILY